MCQFDKMNGECYIKGNLSNEHSVEIYFTLNSHDSTVYLTMIETEFLT